MRYRVAVRDEIVVVMDNSFSILCLVFLRYLDMRFKLDGLKPKERRDRSIDRVMEQKSRVCRIVDALVLISPFSTEMRTFPSLSSASYSEAQMYAPF
jgi:uncharacterized membrane protein